MSDVEQPLKGTTTVDTPKKNKSKGLPIALGLLALVVILGVALGVGLGVGLKKHHNGANASAATDSKPNTTQPLKLEVSNCLPSGLPSDPGLSRHWTLRVGKHVVRLC